MELQGLNLPRDPKRSFSLGMDSKTWNDCGSGPRCVFVWA